MRRQCGLTVRDLLHVRMADNPSFILPHVAWKATVAAIRQGAAARRSNKPTLQHQVEDARKVAPRRGGMVLH
jgi:hypothetical protein